MTIRRKYSLMSGYLEDTSANILSKFSKYLEKLFCQFARELRTIDRHISRIVPSHLPVPNRRQVVPFTRELSDDRFCRSLRRFSREDKAIIVDVAIYIFIYLANYSLFNIHIIISIYIFYICTKVAAAATHAYYADQHSSRIHSTLREDTILQVPEGIQDHL